METHTVEKSTMDALKALSDTNLKVSEARGLLLKLQEDETVYLQGREERAVERIDGILKESDSVLGQVSDNYAKTANLSQEVSHVCDQITSLLTTFSECRELFATKCDEFDAFIGQQEDLLVKVKQDLKVQKTLLDNKEKSLEQAKKQIEIDRRKLNDERGTLERALIRLKEGRI